MVKRRFNFIQTAKYLITNHCEKYNGSDLEVRCGICGEVIRADKLVDLYRAVYKHFKHATAYREEHYKLLVLAAYKTARIVEE